MSKCVGCGVTLQNKSLELPGYVKDLSYSYCERCFRNINYSEIKDNDLNITNEDIIKKINELSDLTFFVVDLFNISSKVIELYNAITTNKYLVVNKMDIIPRDIKETKIKELFNKVYNIKDNIIFTSIKNNNLINYFNGKNIYFCGLSNSGKTSLISHITDNDKLTKSTMINTTQDYLEVSYDSYKIVDSPGFIIKTNKVDSKYQKLINPTKVIKVRNYQVKEHTTLNIHDLFKFTFIDANIVSCYLSNGLLVTKEYHDLDSYIRIDIPSNSDLIIKGIGFLNIKHKGVILIPNELEYEIRSSIF